MAAYRYIDDMTSGDNYNLVRLVENNTITDAWWTVKEATNVSDANAEFSIHITASGTTNGQISVDEEDVTRLLFIALPADTTTLAGLATYYYDIQVKLSTDEVYTLEVGKIFTYDAVTQLSS